MTTGLLFILAVGALVGGWTLLSLFGEERSRRLNDLQARRRAAATAIPLLRVPSSSASTDSPRKAGSGRKPRSAPLKSSDKGK